MQTELKIDLLMQEFERLENDVKVLQADMRVHDRILLALVRVLTVQGTLDIAGLIAGLAEEKFVAPHGAIEVQAEIMMQRLRELDHQMAKVRQRLLAATSVDERLKEQGR